MRVCAQSYYNLLCYIWLISLRDLLFSVGKWRDSRSGGEGGEEELERVKGEDFVVSMYCMREE